MNTEYLPENIKNLVLILDAHFDNLEKRMDRRDEVLDARLDKLEESINTRLDKKQDVIVCNLKHESIDEKQKNNTTLKVALISGVVAAVLEMTVYLIRRLGF